MSTGNSMTGRTSASVKILLRVSGLSYNIENKDDQPVNRFYRHAYFCYQMYVRFVWFYFPLSSFVSALVYWEDFDESATNIVLTLSGIGNISFVSLFVLKRNDLQQLINRLADNSIAPKHLQKAIGRNTGSKVRKHKALTVKKKKISVYAKRFWVCFSIQICATLSWLTKPFLVAFDIISKTNSHIFRVPFPFDTFSTPYYEIRYLFEASVVCIIAVSNFGCIMLLFSIASGLDEHFDSLTSEIVRNGEYKFKENNFTNLRNIGKKVIQNSKKSNSPLSTLQNSDEKKSPDRKTIATIAVEVHSPQSPRVSTPRGRMPVTLAKSRAWERPGDEHSTTEKSLMWTVDQQVHRDTNKEDEAVKDHVIDVVDEYVSQRNTNTFVEDDCAGDHGSLNFEDMWEQFHADVPYKSLTFQQNEDFINQHLVACIQQHQAIIKFANDLIALYSPVILHQLIVGYLGISFYAFQSSQNQESTYALIKYIFTNLIIFMRLFLLSFVGEQLCEKSEGVGEAAYAGQWYERSRTCKFYVGMIMTRAQSPLALKAGAFYNMSFETLRQTVNGSYSLFNVLINIARTKYD